MKRDVRVIDNLILFDSIPVAHLIIPIPDDTKDAETVRVIGEDFKRWLQSHSSAPELFNLDIRKN